MFRDFPIIFLLLISSLTLLCSENTPCIIQFFDICQDYFYGPECGLCVIYFVALYWQISNRYLGEKNMYSVVFGSVLHMSVEAAG